MIDKWYSTLPIFIDIFGKWSDLWLNSQEKPSIYSNWTYILTLCMNIMHVACMQQKHYA